LLGREQNDSINKWFDTAQVGKSPMTPHIMNNCLDLFEEKASSVLTGELDHRLMTIITNFYIMCIQGTEYAADNKGREVKVKIVEILNRIRSPNRPVSVFLLAEDLAGTFNWLVKPGEPVVMGPWPLQPTKPVAARTLDKRKANIEWLEPSVDSSIRYVSDMLHLAICLKKERLVTIDVRRDRDEYPRLMRSINTGEGNPLGLVTGLSRWEGSYVWIMRINNIVRNMENAHRWFSSGSHGASKINIEAFNTFLNGIRSRQPTIPVPVADARNTR